MLRRLAVWLILWLLCSLPARAEDKYASFEELAQHEVLMQDYAITLVEREQAGRRQTVVVIAIHGGAIERGTAELARAVAGADFSLYTFEGIKPRSNAGLHVTSTSFDEPQARALVARHGVCLSLHGCSGMHPRVHVGGRDTALGGRIAAQLRAAGFTALLPGDPGFAAHLGGVAERNICNLCQSGAGVQLELSTGLRGQFFTDWKQAAPPTQPTADFERFAAALRMALGTAQ